MGTGSESWRLKPSGRFSVGEGCRLIDIRQKPEKTDSGEVFRYG